MSPAAWERNWAQRKPACLPDPPWRRLSAGLLAAHMASWGRPAEGAWENQPAGQGCSGRPFLGTPWSSWALRVVQEEGSLCVLLRSDARLFPRLLYQQRLSGVCEEDFWDLPAMGASVSEHGCEADAEERGSQTCLALMPEAGFPGTEVCLSTPPSSAGHRSGLWVSPLSSTPAHAPSEPKPVCKHAGLTRTPLTQEDILPTPCNSVLCV